MGSVPWTKRKKMLKFRIFIVTDYLNFTLIIRFLFKFKQTQFVPKAIFGALHLGIWRVIRQLFTITTYLSVLAKISCVFVQENFPAN
jgi:hypothetical protein